MKVLKTKYGKTEITSNALFIFYRTNTHANEKISYRFLYENLIGYDCEFYENDYTPTGTFINFCHYNHLVYGRNYKLCDKIKKRKKNT